MDWSTIINPILNIGSNAYKWGSSRNNNSSFIQAMKDAEDKRYADTMAYNDAASKYNAEASAAANANANARAGAAAATQRNALAASNKAFKGMDKVYEKTMGIYKPFSDTAASLLPQMTKTYQGGLDGLNLLSAYLMKPENISKLDLSPSQWNTGAPIPEWAKKKGS